jgi:hypothetical protein
MLFSQPLCALYALDTVLPAKPLTKGELEAAMQGHVLARASLRARIKRTIRNRHTSPISSLD